ncbi:enoyl-CoA hydratase/isomerase family protein [Kitasatospora sp. NPDC008050]|uniref:enoyl-CoA hydratase/isomerase family protein n=1 Tax=Kitasatospora sp. NPDC008050 TaxID=3364021 RepID=UPI0036E4AB61
MAADHALPARGPDLRAVVVTGTGPAFCSGADLADLADGHGLSLSGARAQLAAFYRTWLTIRDLAVPTVAAVSGHAVGAGLALALACDLRYAAEVVEGDCDRLWPQATGN